MAVDMSNVKQIMHNNKEVIKIEDSNGNVLWENKKGSTINITIGSRQEMNIQQYSNRIQIPPMPEIRQFISSKTGISLSQIKLTKMNIDGSTLYWDNEAEGEQTPYLSFQSSVSSSTVYFGGGDTVSSNGIHSWSSSKVDLYDIDLNNERPTILYGYIYDNRRGHYYNFKSSARFCTSSNYDWEPTLTIVVTYETS